MTAFTTPTTRTAGQTLNATIWNALANNDTHLTEIQNWTPTVTQSVTVSKTVNYGRYWQAGKRTWAECFLTFSSTGTAANAITLTLPVTASSSVTAGTVLGTFACFEGTTEYVGAVKLATTTTIQFRVSGNTSNLGASPSFALTSTDNLSCTLCYEAA